MSREAAHGTWKILKYYEPVLLPNTKCRSCYYLFIIEAEEIFGNAQETFLFAVEKQKTYSQILSYKLQFLS